MSDARLSGERWNRLRDRIIERYDELVEMLVERYMVDGFPPFTVPLTPVEQYQKLLAMRGANDPAYTENPQAQAALAKLELRFGQAPALGGPLGTQLPARSSQLLGATQTSQKLGLPPELTGGMQ